MNERTENRELNEPQVEESELISKKTKRDAIKVAFEPATANNT